MRWKPRERKKLPSLEEMYEQWWSQIKPDNVSTNQRDEMKKAFMQGAGNMFLVITGDVAEIPEDKGCVYLSGMLIQLTEWLTREADKIIERSDDAHR